MSRGPAPLIVDATPGQLTLSWTPPSHAPLGYLAYRRDASAALGTAPWTLLSPAPVSTTAFADPTPSFSTAVEYRVVALRLLTTASGTFYEQSPGVVTRVTAVASPPLEDGGTPQPSVFPWARAETGALSLGQPVDASVDEASPPAAQPSPSEHAGDGCAMSTRSHVETSWLFIALALGWAACRRFAFRS